MEIYIIVEEGLLIDLDIVVVVMIVRFFCKIILFYGVQVILNIYIQLIKELGYEFFMFQCG